VSSVQNSLALLARMRAPKVGLGTRLRHIETEHRGFKFVWRLSVHMWDSVLNSHSNLEV